MKKEPLTPKKKLLLVVAIVLLVAFAVTMTVGNVVGFWWLKTYILFRRVGYEIETKKCETGHVVFVGDSITDSCDIDRFYEGLDAYNRGISGDVSEGVLRRMDDIVKLQPKLIVLLIGTNDYQRCPTHGNEHILGNYRAILDAFASRLPDTKVLVQSVYPIANVKFRNHYRYGHGHIKELNAGIKALVDEHEGYVYADVFPLLESADEELNMEYSVDGLHPNDKGYEVISGYLRPIIDEMLAS